MDPNRRIAGLAVALAGAVTLSFTGAAQASASTAGAGGGAVAAGPQAGAAVRGTLNGVAAVSSREAWAVGSTAALEPLIVHWNGVRWLRARTPLAKDGQLFGVASIYPSSAWAVGVDEGGTLILHWNGTAWHRVRSPSPGRRPALEAVAVISSRSAWAVGYRYSTTNVQETLILHWNGTAWRQVRAPNPAESELTGVSAVSSTDAWAVGQTSSGPLLLRWNGISWKRVAGPKLPAASLYGVSVTSARNAWAVGVRFGCPAVGCPLVLHWNGTAWKRAKTANPASDPRGNWLFAVAAASGGTWAVGGTSVTSSSSMPLILRWNGTMWKLVRSPNPTGAVNLFGVAVTSARNAWAVGYPTSGTQYAVILHWNGTAWKRVL